MPIEFEAKILDVDRRKVELRLLELGAEMAGEAHQRRYVYDIEPGDQTRWVRLRDTGSKVTLATKHIRHDGIDGTDEVEVRVDDFEKTHQLLGTLGFTAKAYQENRRRSYVLGGAEVEIDSWPRIPDYMEIEGHDREHVVEVAQMLGFTEDQLTGMNTTKVYRHYGIDLAAHRELRF